MTADARATWNPRFRPAQLLTLLLVACAATTAPPDPEAMLWSAQEVSVMVQVEDLEQFLNGPVTDARTATWEKTRTSDGSLRLDYDYFSLLHRMGLSWEVIFHPSVAAARVAMSAAVADLARDSQEAEMTIEIADGFYEWGDESVVAVLKTEGETGGEFFFARYGATTVSLSLAGVYFFEGAEFHRLVGPALANLLFYHPASSNE